MTHKKDFSPTVYKYKDSIMDYVDNSNLFNTYLKAILLQSFKLS